MNSFKSLFTALLLLSVPAHAYDFQNECGDKAWLEEQIKIARDSEERAQAALDDLFRVWKTVAHGKKARYEIDSEAIDLRTVAIMARRSNKGALEFVRRKRAELKYNDSFWISVLTAGKADYDDLRDVLVHWKAEHLILGMLKKDCNDAKTAYVRGYETGLNGMIDSGHFTQKRLIQDMQEYTKIEFNLGYADGLKERYGTRAR